MDRWIGRYARPVSLGGGELEDADSGEGRPDERHEDAGGGSEAEK